MTLLSPSKSPTQPAAGTIRMACNVQTNSKSMECASTHTYTEHAACHLTTVPSAKDDTRQLTIRNDWPAQQQQSQTCINMDYIRPLVQQQIGDVPLEAMVTRISNGRYTISTLLDQVEDWATHGFSLGHDSTLTGKHHQPNYKSSIAFRPGVHKSLLKRLANNKTVGPFAWTGDVSELPFPNCAVTVMI